MDSQTISDQTQDVLCQAAQFTALRWLLIAMVKEHPQKEAVLASFRHLMADAPKNISDRALPDFVQANEVVARIVEEDPEAAAQLADGFVYFAEKLQEYVQHLLEDCQ